MKPSLSKDWIFQIKNGHAYILRQKDRQPVGNPNKVEAVILGLMDGKRTIDDLSNLLQSSIGEVGTHTLQQMLNRWEPFFANGYQRKISYRLERLAQVNPSPVDEGLKYLPGPRVLHWWVTHFCHQRCVYCYANPKKVSSKEEDQISRNRLKQIFREASSLGTKYLLLTGGEPLLRQDLPEIIGDALDYGINPLLTTKYAITRSLCQRLSASGVKHISLSLDTTSKEENKILLGRENYLDQVRQSANNLKEYGLHFSIQAVITGLNLKAIRPLAFFASKMSAHTLQVSPFIPVVSSKNQSLIGGMKLGGDDINNLKSEVEGIKKEFPELNVEFFEELGRNSQGDIHCDIGFTKLFFLPDGRVHRCYKLTRDRSLYGADLRKVSLAAAWHDPGFHSIISPPKEKYQHSPCGDCHQFKQCHLQGRCIYKSWLKHGRYEDQDRECSISQMKGIDI